MIILKDTIKKTFTLEFPLYQNSYDAADELIGEVDAYVGVIAGEEFSISHVIDLGYKGDIQEGMPVIMFQTREELEHACKFLDIDIWEHSLCAYCGKAIRGSFTYNDKGNQCWDCEHKEL